jgi:hypothetical protein
VVINLNASDINCLPWDLIGFVDMELDLFERSQEVAGTNINDYMITFL